MDTRRRCPAGSPPQASSPRLACSRSRSLAKRRGVISSQEVGPRAQIGNFVTFASRDTWSEVDLASCHRPSVWDCAPILRAALVQGSSSNLPNGRRHFGQPRTCSQGGTAGERAARLLGSRSPPTPCVPFAEEFQPYTKSKKQYRTMGSHPLHSYSSP